MPDQYVVTVIQKVLIISDEYLFNSISPSVKWPLIQVILPTVEVDAFYRHIFICSVTRNSKEIR